MMSKLVITLALLGVAVVWVQGESPPFFPPTRECHAPEINCQYECYNPATQACLTYSDGSGGTVCAKGDSHCGGQCLTPGQGKECMQGLSGYQVICVQGQRVCSFAHCYSPATQECVDGHRVRDKE